MPQVPIERHALGNGLRIVLSRDPGAPAVAVNLWYDVGSKHEKAGKTGFAHLFEHMMFQGSANVEKGQHFSIVQAAGGTLNATTWLDRTNYFETLPAHELELALWLEADRMASLLPAMTQEKLDNQRDVVKNERRYSVDNQPYGDWDERMQALVYPDSHPYHHPTIGSMEDLSAASLDDVREFFATYYAPNNAVLTIAGDFEADTALAMIERHFGGIPPNPALPAPPAVEIAPTLGAQVRVTVPDQVPLPRIYEAYRVAPYGTDAFDALDVTADVLGSGRRLGRYGADRRAPAAPRGSTPRWSGNSAWRRTSACSRSRSWAEPRCSRCGSRPDRACPSTRSSPPCMRSSIGWPPTDRPMPTSSVSATSSPAAPHRPSSASASAPIGWASLFDEPERINTEVSRYAAVDAARVVEAMRGSIVEDNRVSLTYVPAEAAS